MREKGKGGGEGGVGTGKGTGTSTRTRLSKLRFSDLPSSFSPKFQAPLSLLFVCQGELTEFFAELTEFAAELSEAQ